MMQELSRSSWTHNLTSEKYITCRVRMFEEADHAPYSRSSRQCLAGADWLKDCLRSRTRTHLSTMQTPQSTRRRSRPRGSSSSPSRPADTYQFSQALYQYAPPMVSSFHFRQSSLAESTMGSLIGAEERYHPKDSIRPFAMTYSPSWDYQPPHGYSTLRF